MTGDSIRHVRSHGRTHDTEQGGDGTEPAAIGRCASCPNECNHPLTVFAKHRVRSQDVPKFDAWFHEITELCSKYPGYLGSELIRPMSCQDDEYVSIFRFNTYDNLQRWMQSNDRQQMIAKRNQFADTPVQYSYHSLEHWFTPADGINQPEDPSVRSSPAAGPPPKYKMVVVTTMVVFSQLFWVPPLLDLVFPNMHWVLAQLLSVFIIVLLASYLIFPVVTRLLAFWLFPQADYSSKLRELLPPQIRSRGATKAVTDHTVTTQSEQPNHDIPLAVSHKTASVDSGETSGTNVTSYPTLQGESSV